MNGPGPETRALLDAARGAYDPTPDARAANRGRTLARVGAAAVAGTAVTASTKAAASAMAIGLLGHGKSVIGTLVVALVGGGALLAVRDSAVSSPAAVVTSAPARTASPPAFRPVARTTVEVARTAADDVPAPVIASGAVADDQGSAQAPAATVAPPPLAPPSRTTARATSPQTPAVASASPPPTTTPAAVAPDGMASEVAVLQAAKRAMSAGDSERALAILDRSAGPGALAEERAATRVVALCGAGRTVEGRAAAARFATEHHGSPLAGRVRSACH